MTTASKLAVMVVRICGLLALVLGIVFWSGNALNLVHMHMGLGVLVVIGLWALCAMSARSGASSGFAVGAAIWGLLVPFVGILQLHIMLDGAHWVIQVIHLILGLGAMGLAEALGGRLKRQATDS